jgi:hybrid cluster-associated redox disulfide protein
VRKETAIFTKDMTIMEAIQADPRAREVFTSYGLECPVCVGVSMESIEDGALMHGVDIEAIMADLNKLASAETSGQE